MRPEPEGPNDWVWKCNRRGTRFSSSPINACVSGGELRAPPDAAAASREFDMGLLQSIAGGGPPRGGSPFLVCDAGRCALRRALLLLLLIERLQAGDDLRQGSGKLAQDLI